jgi:hypothetical protein
MFLIESGTAMRYHICVLKVAVLTNVRKGKKNEVELLGLEASSSVSMLHAAMLRGHSWCSTRLHGNHT